MPRVYRIGAAAFAVLSILLFAAAIATWWEGRLEAATGDGLLLDAGAKSFGESPAGPTFPVEFTLTNRSREPIHVVGANSLCTLAGCLRADGVPLTIPPGEARGIKVVVKPIRPGDFSGSITLYTDCPARSKVPLKVEGRIVGGTGKT